MLRYTLAVGSLIAFTQSPANAQSVISFEEFAADNSNGGIPADRYDFLGVTFDSTDDGSTWDGLTNGDPGNWDLEGTNGPTFSGFNGGSYAIVMLFDSDITAFSLDAARSNGSSNGTLTLEGWRDGVLVETVNADLGDINSWANVSISETVDEVRLAGSGSGFHPFGVDNIQWGGGCPADLDGDGDADADDFFRYLDAFAAGDLDVCDIDGDGDCDADDFFAYLDLFAAGC